MENIIVVNNPKNWSLDIPEVQVVSAKSYLTDERYSTLKSTKVFNLCKSYRYQTAGYYVSLLAAARGHKPMPNVLAIQDLKSQTIIRIASDELDALIQSRLKPIQAETFTLSIYFGKNLARRYDKLSQRLFNQFQAPLLRAGFIKKDNEWIMRHLNPISASDVPDDHKPFVIQAARDFFKKKQPSVSKKDSCYDLAILTNSSEKFPPSDEKALRKFRKAAEALGFYTERITREDAARINEFDALFIRETTNVNHHTYRLARRAAAEGLVVIDDPESILLCTNKVYLAELLRKHEIPAPRTAILSPDNIAHLLEKMEFPCILKQPDSSFSQGVIKVDNPAGFMKESSLLFEKSDLLIAQQFIPTPFDWRVGILAGKPLYACRYYMARKHWQIYKRTSSGRTYAGNAEAVSLEDVPPAVLKYALKAAGLIGSGFYGVDLKEADGRVFVIEVNDNPSIDSGCEDALLKDRLYHTVMEEMLHRIELKKERSTR